MGRVLVLLLAIGFAPGTAHAADLAEIRDTLREVQTSFASLRMVYVTRSSSLELETTFLMAGPAIKVTHRAPQIGVTSKSFDGRLGYQAMNRPEEPDFIATLNIDANMPTWLPGEQSPLKWFGLPVEPTSKPLWELLDGASIIGESQFHGWQVIDVDLGEVTDRGGRARRITCKLSPTHGFAPVLFSQPPGASGSRPHDFAVQSFREIHHPLLGRTIWFPEHMTFGPEHAVELKSLDLNPDLPASDFQIHPQSGTEVLDRTKQGDQQAYVFGGEQARRVIVDEVPAVIPLPGAGVIAEMPQSRFRLYLWLMVVAVFLFAGFWKWRTHSP